MVAMTNKHVRARTIPISYILRPRVVRVCIY